MVSERSHKKMFQNIGVFAFLAADGFVTLESRDEVLHSLRYLRTRDFIYPKLLFHYFEEDTMFIKTKLVVLRKAMYQNTFFSS